MLSANDFALPNNTNLRDAYYNQLYYQPAIEDIPTPPDWLFDSDERKEEEEVPLFDANVQFESVEDEDSRDDMDTTLPLRYLNKMKRYKAMRDKIPSNLAKTEPFQYNNTMSTQATAYSELLMLCQKHGADKSMFDDIVNWSNTWTERDSNVFKSKGKSRKWTRKKTIKHIKKVFGMSGLEPSTFVIELHDSRKVTVPVVDFAEAMRSILDDDNVMKHIMKGLDPTTWRPLTSEDEHENDLDAFIHDKDSGYLYRQGIKIHCPSSPEVDEVEVRPFPVIIHIDKSHSDLFGNLAVAPIQVMPAMINLDGQQKVSSWRQVATIPNLSAGKGKDGKKSKDALLKLKDYHKVMSVALSSFRKCYEEGGFMWKDKTTGKHVLLKPYVQHFVGDIAGVNEMIGHYNTCFANCVTKDCKCEHDDIVSFPPKCSQIRWADLQACDSVHEIFQLYADHGLVSEKDMSDILTDKELATTISKYPISNAFDSLPLSDPYQGIIGMTPQDMLHTMGCGNFKYLIYGIKDVIGVNGTNSRVKGLVNDIFPDIKEYITRNAERDVPRMSNRNGFFNVTSLTNDEIRGNFFGLVCFLHTTYGRDLLEPYFSTKNIDYDLMLETCCLVLAWRQFFLDGQKRKDLLNAHNATLDLQMRMMRDIPREERTKTDTTPGSKGWKIVKFHAMAFVARLNLKFGSARCYDSAINEKNHKYFVKGNAKLTQRISSKFSTQLSNNDHERVVIETVFNQIKGHASKDHSRNDKGNLSPLSVNNGYSDDSDSDESGTDSDIDPDFDNMDDSSLHDKHVQNLMGVHHLHLSINAQKRVTVSHTWKYHEYSRLQIQPCEYVHKTIAVSAIKYATMNNIPQETTFKVECYTGATIRGYRYRATPFWKGGDWYDWACVKFPFTADGSGGGQSVCRIMGFFRYKTPGLMTYSNQELSGLSYEDISPSSTDNQLYAVLHCQTSYFSFKHLQTKFIRKFSMTPTTDMYIVPAQSIIRPVLVIPDIEDDVTASTSNYMAVLPEHKMGKYFLEHVEWLQTQTLIDSDDHSDMEVDVEMEVEEGSEDNGYVDDW